MIRSWLSDIAYTPHRRYSRSRLEILLRGTYIEKKNNYRGLIFDMSLNLNQIGCLKAVCPSASWEIDHLIRQLDKVYLKSNLALTNNHIKYQIAEQIISLDIHSPV